MGLYEFETIEKNLNKDHVYYILFLGDSYSHDKINNKNTAYITDEAMELIEDIFISINKDYDRYGITKYENHEIKLLEKLFVQRLNEIQNNKANIILNDFFSTEWNEILINIYKDNMDEIIILLKNIISWLNKINDKNLIIIGV